MVKKVLKQSQPEEVVYYSDFSGKLLETNTLQLDPPVKLLFQFNYGSNYDGEQLELELDDLDFAKLLEFLKTKMTTESLTKLENLL